MNGVRSLLIPLSWLYGSGILARNWLFDYGILKSVRVSVPVISVGNLAAGGVGKTPLVELIARRLQKKGRKVAIVSRGYKRRSQGYLVVSDGGSLTVGAEQAGDEPAQLASKLTGVIVIVDERRDRGAKRAVKELGADVILLDDGFQHRYLNREEDIVVLSTHEVLKGDRLLPSGSRREPLRALRRASLIAISRCTDLQHFREAEIALRKVISKPVMAMRVKPLRLRSTDEHPSLTLKKIAGKRVVAFSGIGDPGSFYHVLSALGAHVVDHLVFRDHHVFTGSDLARISTRFSMARADFLVTTEKDMKRLESLGDSAEEFMKHKPVYALEIEAEILAGGEELEKILSNM